MNILAKSGCCLKHLKDRYQKGFRKIEIQLTKEFLEEDKTVEYFSSQILNNNWDILNIHMPLAPNLDDINLEYLTHPEYLKIFQKTCELADVCSKYYNHHVTIVIHSEMSLKTFKNIPLLLEQVVKILCETISKYPLIDFSIENVCAYAVKTDYIQFTQNAFAENVELAQYLNHKVCNNKFFTTFDICHYLMAMKALSFLKNETAFQYFTYNLEWYFLQNQQVINNIHLNNIRNCGINKMDHGASFNEFFDEDMHLLDEIFRLYKKYNYTCNITLEVDELDYNDIKEAKKLRELIEKRYKQ